MKHSRIPLWPLSALLACAAPLPREQADALLHNLADSYQARDPDAYLGYYSQEPEGFRRSLSAELDSYREVAQAKFVLDDLRRQDDERYEAQALFQLYAHTQSGERYQARARVQFLLQQDAEGKLSVLQEEENSRTESRSASPLYQERTGEAGLTGFHTPHTPYGEKVLMTPGLFSGAGAAAGDIDQDGDLDLMVADGARSRLYRNQGPGQFEEITESAGLGTVDKARGAYFFDQDDDGRLDILITRVQRTPQLFHNEGDGVFSDASHLLGDLPPAQYQSASFADWDQDGDLDIFLLRYGEFDETSWAFPLYEAEDGVPDLILENTGDGFRPRVDPVLTPPGWGLAVTSGDYDNDGDLDIYLVNDFGSNRLFRNEGNWRFTDVTQEAGVADRGFGMSASMGDYDRDGDLDIYVANMNSSSRWALIEDEFPLPLIAHWFLRDWIKEELLTVTRGNSLFQNQGDGTFRQLAAELDVERAGWAWAADFFDFDNDGDLDLYCPNGYVTGSGPDT